MLYILFGSLSFALLGGTIAYSIISAHRKQGDRAGLSALHIMTFGVFGATLLMFLPIYYGSHYFGDDGAYIRPALVAIHHTFRTFILDGEFDIIVASTAGLDKWLRILYSAYAAILYVMAPLLTFGNVLSLFKNFKDEIRLAVVRNRPIYIFSELNVCSLALAKSVCDRYNAQHGAKWADKPVIVFTDVFIKNQEEDYELMQAAKDLGAICLKKDVTRLNCKRKGGHVTYFLLGADESENIEQAIRLTQDNKDKPHRAIFLYSPKQNIAHILDSLDKGDLTIAKTLKEAIEKDPFAFLSDPKVPKNAFDDGFYVRRINNVEALTIDILTDEDMKALFDSKDKVISLAILGMGSYGREFLRNAIWLYQVLGYRLEINVFDSDIDDGGHDMLKSLRKEWPEIILNGSKTYVRDAEGDCRYSIKFYTGIDCFSSDFDALFAETSEEYDRLRRTQMALVALGDDDRNIDAAIMLRQLFDRIRKVGRDVPQNRVQDLPLLYAVVYDDKKTANLSCGAGRGLINYRGDPLHINFIGSLQTQFSYDIIDTNKRLELDALRYHLEWMWHSHSKMAATIAQAEEAGKMNMDMAAERAKLIGDLEVSLKKYATYEYYRHSSISRALHQQLLQNIRADLVYRQVADHTPDCKCEKCLMISAAEHARWNAYMRTHGYRYGAVRSDRGLTHPDLVVWEELSEDEQDKDDRLRQDVGETKPE